ncbi:hypothetical protein Malapachy_1808 [Malassezia pachydermatis]|uniref:Uncharacterized protein n=1 Tax=Malassezia pachydermatis TaxID=77020 RepID=A0A0M9VNV0_9BASI|nr:hypothetical protein Malapachy_1808 [Malassezia pachydermatis]KOS13739.1 hypothetical protein Malapachy_1808 [Malassezia pachydermatis]
MSESDVAVTATTTQPQQQQHQPLGDWVESLLAQIESRLDEKNKQVAQRMADMAERIDALEASIQDLVHGPAPQGTPSL